MDSRLLSLIYRLIQEGHINKEEYELLMNSLYTPEIRWIPQPTQPYTPQDPITPWTTNPFTPINPIYTTTGKQIASDQSTVVSNDGINSASYTKDPNEHIVSKAFTKPDDKVKSDAPDF